MTQWRGKPFFAPRATEQSSCRALLYFCDSSRSRGLRSTATSAPRPTGLPLASVSPPAVGRGTTRPAQRDPLTRPTRTSPLAANAAADKILLVLRPFLPPGRRIRSDSLSLTTSTWQWLEAPTFEPCGRREQFRAGRVPSVQRAYSCPPARARCCPAPALPAQGFFVRRRPHASVSRTICGGYPETQGAF
jgi:hypothetical protein